MKAISNSRHGGADVLESGEWPDPEVGPDTVLVKVRAAAINPVDRKDQEGRLAPGPVAVLPLIPDAGTASSTPRSTPSEARRSGPPPKC